MRAAKSLTVVGLVGFLVLSWGAAAYAITISNVAAPPAAVPKYGKAELMVTLSGVTATKPYEPDPARGGLDLYATFTGPGATRTVYGFHDGAAWRIRFAPDAVGTWTYAVTARDPSGTSNTVTGSFGCEGSPYPGWARIDGRTLRFPNGQALFAVGHNNGWQTDVEQPSLADMAARGENLLSFWLATPWYETSWGPEWAARAPIENTAGGIGNYNQAACAYLDGLVDRAEGAGVYLLPTLWPHGQLRDTGHPWGQGWWYNNAYSTICTATNFFKTGTSTQWRYQKNFYRYLIARWGYSRAIAGWVAICEIDGTTGYYLYPSQATAWCASVRDYFRTSDPFRKNAANQTPVAGTKLNSPSWEGGFDLRSTDNYVQQRNNVEVAAALASDTATMRSSGKPSFHAEFGGDVLNGASQPAHLHNGIWAGTCAGAASTPLLWCDGGNFPMLDDAMQSHLQHLAGFIGGIEYQGDPSLVPATPSINDTNCRGWAMKLADRGFAWIQNKTATMGGQVVSISGLAAGTYAVLWFDAWTSGVSPIRSDRVTVASDGVLRAASPVLARADIALKFAPIVNNPPVAADDTYQTDEDTGLTVPASGVLANDTDADGDPLAAILLTSPSHGTLSLAPDGSFTYAPNPNFNGTDTFTYKANDGSADSNPATATLTVNPVNDPPVADSQEATTVQDTALAITLTASDIDGDALTYIVLTGPSHGGLTGAAPDLTYTPAAGYTGADSFTFTANDGSADSNIATVAITVTKVNHPPVASDQAVTTPEDSAAAVTLAATDPDGDPLTYTVLSGPSHGTLTGAAPALVYTPAANYNGSDSFTFKANDGQADSNAATVAITVEPVNDPPVARDDAATTTDGTPVTVTVLANDSDADGDPLTVISATAGSHGAATINGGQTVTYTPDPGFTGTDAFTYTISDGHGGTASATVTVTVNPSAPTAVVAVAMSAKAYSGYWKATATVTLTTPSGSPIASATVYGHWSGVYSGSVSKTTSGTGKAAFTSGSIRTSGTVTFTVDRVVKSGQTYLLTGDTDGSITGSPKGSRGPK